MMVSNITATIATSIMPKRIEVQQAAVKSWQRLGFRVVSVNDEAELATLSPLFEGVHFVPAAQNAAKTPLVPISEIFKILGKFETDICGIINSDIILSTGLDFIDFLWRNTEAHSLVFGPRLDVNEITSRSGRTGTGYDYFFFRKELLLIRLYGDFTLGSTWWDYWLPVSLAINGVRLKYLIVPVGFHPKHPSGWNEDDLKKGKKEFIAGIKKAWNRSKNHSLLSARSNSVIERLGIEGFAESIPSAILLDSDCIIHAQQSVPLEKVEIMVNTFKDHIEAYEAVVLSRSWRWTRGARTLASGLHNKALRIVKGGAA